MQMLGALEMVLDGNKSRMFMTFDLESCSYTFIHKEVSSSLYVIALSVKVNNLAGY